MLSSTPTHATVVELVGLPWRSSHQDRCVQMICTNTYQEASPSVTPPPHRKVLVGPQVLFRNQGEWKQLMSAALLARWPRAGQVVAASHPREMTDRWVVGDVAGGVRVAGGQQALPQLGPLEPAAWHSPPGLTPADLVDRAA